MEELMYFVWSNRLFNSITTIDQSPLEIIHPGLRNLDAGPDFFNAKVMIDGVLWAGNVEMHCKASDWYKHKHQDNPAYDNVILHVVLQADAIITRPNGQQIQTVVMKIPADVMSRFQNLNTGNLQWGSAIRCAHRIPAVPQIILHDWLTSLAIQRMTAKVQRVNDLINDRNESWQEALYVILCRSFGTGINSDPFERLARSLPYSFLQKHIDNPLQIRAMLLGQAGLINSTDTALLQEYNFLKAKFNLTPLNPSIWKNARMRPYAMPEARINALTSILCKHQNLFSEIIEAKETSELQKIFLLPRQLGEATVRSILINAVVPIMLAYAQWQANDEAVEKSIAILEALPAESNRYMDYWIQVGVPIRNAFDSQALLHLYKEYCEHRKCMRCRIGCWMVKHKEDETQ